MAEIEKMMETMKESIRTGVSFEARGIGTYLVHTGFTYPDGDELHIVLREKNGEWVLTDDGHTMMWLSYEDFNLTETRSAALGRTLASNHAEMTDGRIRIPLGDRDPGAVLKSFIQALLQTADLLYLDRQNVRGTFSEDVKDLFRETFGEGCEFDKKISNGGETYDVDVYVPGNLPILVFAVANQERCINAAYAILALTVEKKEGFASLAIVDTSANIRAEDRNRIANRSDKIFFDVPDAGDAALTRFLSRVAAPTH
ncbi:MAG: DUF1828 domain-containing protein [Thermoplasmatales archaeon]|nr:DUF1828 domain-containing protein [Thermoplasmatales archaeon]